MGAAADAVQKLIAANEARDLDRIVAVCTDDVLYENVPMTAVHGGDEVRATLEPMYAQATGVEFRVERQVEDGDTVANERVDRFEIGGRWIEIRVAGFFEVRDGKVAVWRDYFDLQQFMSQMGGAGAGG
jgi:limonene-1,2-epoxide hydrolase